MGEVRSPIGHLVYSRGQMGHIDEAFHHQVRARQRIQSPHHEEQKHETYIEMAPTVYYHVENALWYLAYSLDPDEHGRHWEPTHYHADGNSPEKLLR